MYFTILYSWIRKMLLKNIVFRAEVGMLRKKCVSEYALNKKLVSGSVRVLVTKNKVKDNRR